MDFFNTITTLFFKILFYPLHFCSALWGLVIVSVLTGLLMLVIFKKVSNQDGIVATKNRIKAHLLATRLYKHDAVLLLGALAAIFKENGRYFLFALKPVLVLCVPVMVLVVQLSAHYGYKPAQINQPILVHAFVAKDIDVRRVSLDAPPEIDVEDTPLRIPLKNETCWRIRPLENGSYNLKFSYAGHTVTKKLIVGDDRQILAAKRVQAHSLAALLYPAEQTLESNCFMREIKINYPEQHVYPAGIKFHWLVFSIIASIVTGLLFKRFFRVQL